MNLMRVGLVHPEKMELNARLNLLGVEELLKQEGISWTVVRPEVDPAKVAAQATVLLALDHACFSANEETGLARLAKSIPMVWTGIPRPDAAPALMEALALTGARVDDSTNLRLVHLRAHPTTAPFAHEKERTLRMKFVEQVLAPCPAGGQEIANLTLGDGTPLGAAIFAQAGRPRRVTFTFPLGKVYAYKTSHYTDSDHLDQNDFPICTLVDVLRALLREALHWAAGDSVLVRKYYWPARGDIPRGLFSTNHDLCGYSEEGVKYIRRVCEEAGVHTTFFDLHPFRLKVGEAGPHDVCLHAGDSTTDLEFAAQKQELEALLGHAVRGWRRHGCTKKENHPAVWHHAVRAGIQWASTHNVQTHPYMGSAYHVATSNRLPGSIMDLVAGERMPFLEIPAFDTGEDDRLSDFFYGPKLPWDEFVAVVEARQDYAARHNLMAAYLVHGWTAGTERELETYERGALDGKRMLPLAIQMAKARGLTFMGCDELYDWWQHRQATQLELAGDCVEVKPPSGAWTTVLELVPPQGQALALTVDGQPAQPQVWVDRGRTRYMLPLPGAARVCAGPMAAA